MIKKAQVYFPGIITCVTIAMASTFISDHHGGPVMLFALLFGSAFHFLNDNDKCKQGIDFCAKTLLRLGVALLGFRITFGEISALGVEPLLIVFVSVALTIVLGILVAKFLKLSYFLGVLASCSVAICGASAALAVASILPFYKDKERDTIFVVVVVTALSTVAMIFYPIFVQIIGFDVMQMGAFLGGTIHDVAQVVGAGYTISDDVGDTATVIKLFRVALLVPVVVLVSCLMRKHNETSSSKSVFQIVPWFLIAFVAIVIVNSVGVIPEMMTNVLSETSRWLLVAAIAALGVKTSFQALGSVGLKPIMLIVICTLIIAVAHLSLAMVIQ